MGTTSNKLYCKQKLDSKIRFKTVSIVELKNIGHLNINTGTTLLLKTTIN